MKRYKDLTDFPAESWLQINNCNIDGSTGSAYSLLRPDGRKDHYLFYIVDGWVDIEIGGRMGGDCIGSDLVRYSTGVDFVRAVIQVACGMEPDLRPCCEPMAVESRFIFTREDDEAFLRLQREEPDRLLRVVDYHPENIGGITDSSNRAGCYIIKA